MWQVTLAEIPNRANAFILYDAFSGAGYCEEWFGSQPPLPYLSECQSPGVGSEGLRSHIAQE